ncbi:hypothetical protein RIR_jg24511.t1 [Rhizophagus irregularis DAOM 181602=DAOM 197198]|nr:hypothetical protein RIR_jg24511.t1 [Rhizophagus irregularis DAOM 181602=DAOM 197198]
MGSMQFTHLVLVLNELLTSDGQSTCSREHREHNNKIFNNGVVVLLIYSRNYAYKNAIRLRISEDNLNIMLVSKKVEIEEDSEVVEYVNIC